MMATIDGQWLQHNAPLLMDAAAAAAGVEFHRGTEAFMEVLERIGTPDPDKRELFRGIFDGRYKLVRYFGLGHYHLPKSVDELLANNDVALYDLRNDPEEMNNLANPDSDDYDQELLATMNAKLNALIEAEIGEDKALFEP
jgi:arylsulfatase